MAKFKQNQGRWRLDWFRAFEDHGRDRATADILVQECETWATNNPDMSWDEIFDAVILTDETKE